MGVQAVLHNLPRFTWRLRSASNEWQPPNDDSYFWADLVTLKTTHDYEQSNQFVFLFPVLLLISLWCVFQLVLCSLQQRDFADDDKVHWRKGRLKTCTYRLQCIVFTLALGAMVTVVVYVIIFSSELSHIGEKLNDSWEPYQESLESGSEVLTLINNTRNGLYVLNESGVEVDDLEEKLKTANDLFTDYYSIANEINWRSSEYDIVYQQNGIRDVSLVWFGFCMLMFLLVYFKGNLYGRHFCCGLDSASRFFLDLFVLLGVTVIFSVVFAQLALSIQVADVCADFDGSVEKIVAEEAKPVWNITLYYVYCDGRFDYRSGLDDGYEIIVECEEQIAEVVEDVNSSALNTSVKVVASNVESWFTQTLYNVAWLVFNGTDCNATGIHKEYAAVKEAICYDGLNDWFILYLLQSVVGCLLILSRCCFWRCCRQEVNALPRSVSNSASQDFWVSCQNELDALPPSINLGKLALLPENRKENSQFQPYYGSIVCESLVVAPNRALSLSDRAMKAEINKLTRKLRSIRMDGDRERAAEAMKASGSSPFAVEKSMAIIRREGLEMVHVPVLKPGKKKKTMIKRFRR